MTGTSVGEQLQGVFGALLGGMIASFIAMCVFVVVQAGNGSSSSWVPYVAVGIGLTCAIGLMTAGLYMAERSPWLGTTFLFASGFTTIWTVAVSFSVQPAWVMLLAFAITIAIGVNVGSRRFGRVKRVEPVVVDEAAR